MTSRRAQRRRRDDRCEIAIVEVPGDASGCFEIRCGVHGFYTHTTSGFEAAEIVALRHAMGVGQTLDRREIRS